MEIERILHNNKKHEIENREGKKTEVVTWRERERELLEPNTYCLTGVGISDVSSGTNSFNSFKFDTKRNFFENFVLWNQG